MCRFLAYAGEPVRLEEMLYRPEHSIIHQSVHAHEREEPLNGDGWGVGWYDPRLERHPGLYRTLHPAWSDDNMRHIAPLVETPAFFTHVRAASPGLPVQRLNCHPFQGGLHTHDDPGGLSSVERGRRRLLFMHNGAMGGFHRLKRPLQKALSEDAYHGIRGSTDSEHLFALVQEELGDGAADPSAVDLADAMRDGIERLVDLRARAGVEDTDLDLNLALTDGEALVAVRFAGGASQAPPSLYLGQAGGVFCEDSGRLAAREPEGGESVLVASERLWQDDRVWTRIDPQQQVIVDGDREVRTRTVEVGG